MFRKLSIVCAIVCALVGLGTTAALAATPPSGSTGTLTMTATIPQSEEITLSASTYAFGGGNIGQQLGAEQAGQAAPVVVSVVGNDASGYSVDMSTSAFVSSDGTQTWPTPNDTSDNIGVTEGLDGATPATWAAGDEQVAMYGGGTANSSVEFYSQATAQTGTADNFGIFPEITIPASTAGNYSAETTFTLIGN